MTAPAPYTTIPRLGYGMIVLGATAAAFGVAWLMAARLGANEITIRSLMIGLGIGSFATAVPAVIAIRREYWGLSVLLAGLARGMLTLGFCFATRGPETLSRPLFLSASAALLLLLVAEVVASIKILSALERSAPGACNRNPA